jgi:hypothetical protein
VWLNIVEPAAGRSYRQWAELPSAPILLQADPVIGLTALTVSRSGPVNAIAGAKQRVEVAMVASRYRKFAEGCLRPQRDLLQGERLR